MGWNSWRDWASEQRRIRYVLQGAVNRMLKRKLSMAFEKWQYETEKAKEQARMMSGAIKRMQNMAISKGWEQWQFWYEEVVYQKEQLRKALMRMVQRKLGMALNRWLEWYEQLMAQRALLANAAMRWAKRALSAAWNTWYGKLAYADEMGSFGCRDSDHDGGEGTREEASGLEFLVPWSTKPKRRSRWDVREKAPRYNSRAYVAPEVAGPATHLSRTADKGRRREARGASGSAAAHNVTSFNARMAQRSTGARRF